MKKILGFILILTIITIFSSCMTVTYEWAPQNVAILPFMNESADVEVGIYARMHLSELLKNRRKHNIIPLEQVDSVLNEMGITEGGQLSTTTVAELSQKLGADGIVYGNVITAKRVMLGIYFNKEFECHYQMYRGSDEQIFWDEQKKSSDKKFVLNPGELLETAGKAMVTEIASDMLIKAFKSHPLYEQIDIVTRQSIRTFPYQ